MLLDELNLDRDSLRGRVVLITGASQETSQELARCLGWLGAAIALVDNDWDSDDLAAQLSSNGVDAQSLSCDCSRAEEVQQLAQQVQDWRGVPDFIVHSDGEHAGISVLELDAAALDDALGRTARAGVLLAQTFLPLMFERGTGMLAMRVTSLDAPIGAGHLLASGALTALVASLIGEPSNQSAVRFVYLQADMVETGAARAEWRQVTESQGFELEEILTYRSACGFPVLSVEQYAVGCVAALLDPVIVNLGQIDIRALLKRLGLGVVDATKRDAVINDAQLRLLRLGVSALQTALRVYADAQAELDDFKRAWNARMLKSRSGHDLPSWQHRAAELELLFTPPAGRADGAPDAMYAWLAEHGVSLRADLSALLEHISGFARHQRRFAEDEVAGETVHARLIGQLDDIQALIAALPQLH